MKIAILLATYNGEKYIKEQLDSIFAQTYKDWVVYIHDDGSKDNTMQIVNEYVKKYPEQVVIVDGPSTGGARNNFFYLMSKVDAKYYMCCDQDDVWLPEKVEKTFNLMQKTESSEGTPCLVFTDLTVVDGELNIIAEQMSKYQNLKCQNTSINQMLMQNVVTGCTMMMNKSLCHLATQYTNVNNIIMHDWWVAIIAEQFGKVAYLDEPTILYRQHGNNTVGALDSKSMTYVVNKAKAIENNKQSIINTQIQAEEMVRTFSLDKESMPAKLASCRKLKKFQRLDIYRKNNLKKIGFARNIGLILWG